jgi:two-component system, sensor histidine kinase and response regulator
LSESNFLYRIIYVFVFFYCSVIHAQNPVNTSIRVDSLNEAAFKLKRSNVSAALNLLYQSQYLASQTSYKKGLAISYMYEAGIYQQQAFSKRAQANYYQAYDLFRNLKDTFNMARINQQIAAILLSEGYKDSALAIYYKSLAVFQNLNKKEEVINIKNSIGLIRLKQKETEKGEQLFNEALNESKEIKYTYGEKKALQNLGLAATMYKDFNKARYFLRQSLQLDSLLKDNYGMAFNLMILANMHKIENQFDSAQILHMLSYKLAYGIPAYEILVKIIEREVELNKAKGDLLGVSNWQDSAITMLRRQRSMDLAYASELIDIIKRQQTIRRDREDAFLKAERVSREQFYIITVGTFIMIILAVLVVLVFINFQRQKFLGIELRKKNKQIEDHATELRGLNTEISEQNKLLESDNRTKDKLLSIISHDLRNPLVNTKGILNLVNQKIIPDNQAKQLLVQLETQYMGTTSLLDNLLFWLRGQMQGKNLEKVKVNVAQITKSLEEEHRMLLQRKNIRFSNHIIMGTEVFADKEMIRIVLRNLISNAIKFTPEGGTIELKAEKIENVMLIIVQDSGIGIDPLTIEKIKAKQYYTTAGTAMEKGSGFGLMLCSDLINRHNGKLEILSEVGIGSKFIIHIPA